jgi:ABC-type oligopeptide transport system substrate-binding subunit
MTARRSRLARLVTLLGAVGALAALLAGCSLPWQSQPSSDMAKDQTLRMIWDLPFVQPDPGTPYFASLIQLDNLLFDGLVTEDRNGHVEPWGASAWAVSADGLTYTFTLRKDQRFSDGTPVKPSDYAWSINRAASPCFQSPLGYLYDILKDGAAFGAENCIYQSKDEHPDGAIQTLVGDAIIPDDAANTLTMKLERPAGYFLAALTNPVYFVIERSFVAQFPGAQNGGWFSHMSDIKTGQGGSGMFYLAAQTSTLLTLKPNPYWWGRHAGKTPHFSEVDITVGRSPRADFTAFTELSTLAFADNVVALQPHFPLAEGRRQPYYHEQPLFKTTVLQFNWRGAPFDDLNARKAFCLAINRDQINQQVYQGAETPTWSLAPPELPDYNGHPHGLDNAPVTGDAALAQQYWRRYLAAHPNQPPSQIALDYVADPGSAQGQTITLLLDSWRHTFGVKFPAMNFWAWSIPEFATFPIDISGWYVDYFDPQDFLSVQYASDSFFDNVIGPKASVPAADALMRQADALSDMRQRVPLYQQVEQLLIDNVAVCPLFQEVNRYALRPWVKGDFVEDGRGFFPNDDWVSGYIAKH